MPSTHCGEKEDIEPVSNVAAQKDIDNEDVSMVRGNLIKEGVHVDENVPAIIHDLSQDHTLVLQNSFILLNDENDRYPCWGGFIS
jgi:hypothetical protein